MILKSKPFDTRIIANILLFWQHISISSQTIHIGSVQVSTQAKICCRTRYVPIDTLAFTEILNLAQAKVLKDGIIARLKKRNQKTDEFREIFAGEDIP